MKKITIYTDGASRGNPGKGGWAAILLTDKAAVELAGRADMATNNQMELTAVIKALAYVIKHDPKAEVYLHADSAYVINGMNSWLKGWVRNNWITSAKKPVENRNLWEKMLELKDALGTRLELIKVAGHSGHLYNDRCDELAVLAALDKDPALFEGTIKEYEKILSENPPKSEKKKPEKKTGTAYSYVSYVDGKVYTDKTWAACEKRVKGKKGAKFKKVFSKAEETSFVQDYTLQSLF